MSYEAEIISAVRPLAGRPFFRYNAVMEHQLNIPLEIFRATAVFRAFLGGGFYRLVRSGARWRRALLLLFMAAFRPVWFFTGIILNLS